MTQQQVFISYSSKNQDVADDVCKQLEDAGIKCWIAHRDESAGSHFGGEIVEAIEKCQLVVLIFSEFANSSMHIESEIALAFEYKKTIIPFIIDDTEMNRKLKYSLAATHKLIAYPDYTQKITALLTAVSKQLGIDSIDQNTEQGTSSDINNSVMFEQTEDKLKAMEESLESVSREINKKINNLSDDLDYLFRDIINYGTVRLEDAVDSSCRKMRAIVDSWGLFSNAEKLQSDIEREFNVLTSRTLKMVCDDINREAKHGINNTLYEFSSSTKEILKKLPADFKLEQRYSMKNISRQVDFYKDDSLFDISADVGTDDYTWGDTLFDFFNGFTFGALGIFTTVFSHNTIANYAKEWILKIQNTFDAKSFLEGITSEKDNIIIKVKKHFIDELLIPLHEKLEEIKRQGIEK